MDVKEILKHVDHTLLLQPSTWEEIKQICDDAMEYGTASVCIPPSYVKQAAEYMNGKMAVCTVIGFPNGYMTTSSFSFMELRSTSMCFLQLCSSRCSSR